MRGSGKSRISGACLAACSRFLPSQPKRRAESPAFWLILALQVLLCSNSCLCKGAMEISNAKVSGHLVSIRAPTKGAIPSVRGSAWFPQSFNSYPREGGNQFSVEMETGTGKFQLVPPQGGNQVFQGTLKGGSVVSIRFPARGTLSSLSPSFTLR